MFLDNTKVRRTMLHASQQGAEQSNKVSHAMETSAEGVDDHVTSPRGTIPIASGLVHWTACHEHRLLKRSAGQAALG